jgi:hypothetical protein
MVRLCLPLRRKHSRIAGPKDKHIGIDLAVTHVPHWGTSGHLSPRPLGKVDQVRQPGAHDPNLPLGRILVPFDRQQPPQLAAGSAVLNLNHDTRKLSVGPAFSRRGVPLTTWKRPSRPLRRFVSRSAGTIESASLKVRKWYVKARRSRQCDCAGYHRSASKAESSASKAVLSLSRTADTSDSAPWPSSFNLDVTSGDRVGRGR